ncbi:MAG: hypothetical protein K9L22_08210 [Methylococcaceae bacterium]|nr:hypothetical protein [Methylococcaceae bacterium]
MKTSLIIGIFTAAITLIPSISSANSDDSKYPAANFQPKVIYMNEEATKSSTKFIGEKSAFDPKYPAANFEPKVIYP